jgi:hypothetical protein
VKVLTDEAQAERDTFHSCYGFFGCCSCHSMPPCGFCTHPGNPTNQEEDESCWREEPLQAGTIYLSKFGWFGEFSRIGGTGMGIFHPPGEPDMQSSWAADLDKIEREATPEEAKAYKEECNYVDEE